MATGDLFRESIAAAVWRRAIDGLSAGGFRAEAISLAGYVYTGPWSHASAERFARGAGLWGVLRLTRRTPYKQWPILPLDVGALAALRVGLQFRSWGEGDPFLLVGRPSSDALAARLIGLGEALVKGNMMSLAATTLACAARPEVAEKFALDRLSDLVGKLPHRDVKEALRQATEVTSSLDRSAHMMADLKLFAPATMTRLVAMIPELDEKRYQDIARHLIGDTTRSTQQGAAVFQTKIDLGGELWRRGYWAQALDLLDSTIDVSPWDRATWGRMWETVADKTRTSSNVAAAAASLLTRKPTPDRALTDALGGLDSWLARAGMASMNAFPTGSPSNRAAEIPAPVATVALKPRPRESTQRRAIVTITRLHEEGRAYRVRVRIGVPRQGESGQPFTEPVWGERHHLDLCITLEAQDAEVSPAWQELRLPRLGDSDTIAFRVLAQRDGELQLYLRIYTATDFVLLEEYDLKFTVTERNAA